MNKLEAMKCWKIYILIVCIVVVFFSMSFSCYAGAATSPSVIVDGQPVSVSEDMGTPFIDSNQRTQVPLRITMEAIGAKVEWDSGVRMAIVSKGNITVRVPVGAEFVWVNGEKKTNDTAAVIVNNRTYLPIRVVAEALGASVEWDGTTRTVKITTHGNPAVWMCSGVTLSGGGERIGSFSYEWNESSKTVIVSSRYDSDLLGYYGCFFDYEYKWPYSWPSICDEKPLSDYVSSYQYYVNSNSILTLTNEYSSTTYKYDGRCLLTERTTYSKGNAYFNSYQETTNYSYNHFGLKTYEITHGKELDSGDNEFNQEIWYEHNSKGDVTKVLVHDMDYDSWDQFTYSYSYDHNGRIAQMIAYNAPYGEGPYPSRVMHEYTYNSYGKVITEEVTVSDDGDDYNPSSTWNYTISNHYDENGNLVCKTASTDASAEEAVFTYRHA